MTQKFTLGKKERLKSLKQIDQLFEKGEKFHVGFYRAHYILKKGETGLQFGIGVSSKQFKKAVDRNRVKRLTREAWRLNKNDLVISLKEANLSLNIFLIYTGKTIASFMDVKDITSKLISKLILITTNSK